MFHLQAIIALDLHVRLTWVPEETGLAVTFQTRIVEVRRTNLDPHIGFVVYPNFQMLYNVCYTLFKLSTDKLDNYPIKRVTYIQAAFMYTCGFKFVSNIPWYISNLTLHNDLRIPYV
jgi:hypothetical protein